MPVEATRSERFAYHFDIWYTSDPLSEVYLLAFINAVFVVILFVAFTVTGSLTDLDGGEWYSEMFWMSWGQLSGKAPKARDPDGALWPTRTVRVFAAFAGMFAFSLIVGFIKSAIKGRIKAVKLGKGRVFEENFSMIIGWNDRILPLVDQLTMANESSGGGVIVVMAPKKKPWMDGVFVDNIEDWRGSKIVTRKGDPINQGNLMKAAAPFARSIVVLSQGDDADEADAQAARCTLAITGGKIGKFFKGHLVVELRDIDNQPVVRMGIPDEMSEIDKKRRVCPLVGNDLIGRLMVQCSQEAGLAHVFAHILEFSGNEFYFSDGKDWMSECYGETFAKVAFKFSSAVVIGIKLGMPREDGQLIVLNPLGSEVVEEGDSLLVIAEDDDTYWAGPDMSINAGVGPDIDPPPEPPTKTLLVGWRRDIQDMIFELNKWVEPGSQLTLMNHSLNRDDAKAELEHADCFIFDVPPEENSCGNLTVTFEECQPIFRRELEKADIPSYDAILVLTEELGADGLSSDSRSMITMLLCRDLQKEAVRLNHPGTFGYKKPATEACIIAEILDPRTAQLISIAKTDDHVVSNSLISMALGQISEQADLSVLIDDLFSEEGNEIHIKPINLYAFEGEPLTFWQILNRARQRGEVAIGYQRLEDMLAGAAEKGLVLNPLNKEELIHWKTGDKIVVLSED